MNTDEFEGHTPIWYLYGEVGAWWVQSDFTTHDDFIVAEVRSQNEVDAKLIAAAPDLLAEVIHSRKLLAHIARDENIAIVGYDGTRYTPDGTYGTEESE